MLNSFLAFLNSREFIRNMSVGGTVSIRLSAFGGRKKNTGPKATNGTKSEVTRITAPWQRDLYLTPL